jgi:hypothetical protein
VEDMLLKQPQMALVSANVELLCNMLLLQLR